MQRAKIHLLPPELRNQIAAGEVVERPASVVKELVENALDAKATEISVIVEDGGQSLISVQDNGIGIAADELELAVTRHATSKLQTAADLSHILSYGFRGEALPSIASVSRFRIVSKTAEDPIAHELAVNFGDIREHAPAVLRRGTLIEVRDLFFNIPARLKFLKAPSTELKRAVDLFVRLALVADGVSMSLVSGGRTAAEFFADEDKKAKLAKIWSSAIIDELVPVDYEGRGIRLSGYISNPRSVQPRADRMLLYVNGRAVSDKLLLKAVRQAYAGKITSRDYPQCLLFLEIDPREVDVNVHPAKSEVRFRDEKALFYAMAQAVEQALSACASYFSAKDLQQGTAEFGPAEPDTAVRPSAQAKFGDLYQEQHTPKPQGFWGNADKETRLSFAREKQEVLAVSPAAAEYVKSALGAAGAESDTCGKNAVDGQKAYMQTDDFAAKARDNGRAERSQDFSGDLLSSSASRTSGLMREPAAAMAPLGAQLCTGAEYSVRSEKFGADTETQNLLSAADAETYALPYGLEYLGQVAETYLILKKDNAALLLLDQHAAHERILYEEMKKGQIQSQPLLYPLELPLHASEEKRLETVQETLAELGFALETVTEPEKPVLLKISAVPSRYDRVEAMGFLKEILAEKMDSLDSVWVRHACKSAIKANTPLDRAAAVKLIVQWLKTDEPDNCPHGRPCVLHFDSADLEKLFKRTL